MAGIWKIKNSCTTGTEKETSHNFPIAAQVPNSIQILFVSEKNREYGCFFLVLVSKSADTPILQYWGWKRKLLFILNGEGRCSLVGW